jgi:excinuclease UvrABC ATPase subunit
VLEQTEEEALEFFDNQPSVRQKIQTLLDL